MVTSITATTTGKPGMLGRLPAAIAPMKSALLIIDVQRVLFDKASRPFEADIVVDRISLLAERAFAETVGIAKLTAVRSRPRWCACWCDKSEVLILIACCDIHTFMLKGMKGPDLDIRSLRLWIN